MKRATSEFLLRHLHPGTAPTVEQTVSGAADDAIPQPAGLTIEALRNLPLPPFPQGLEVTACDVVARIARDGFHQRRDRNPARDLFPLLRFCTKHACADALVWFLLRMDQIAIDEDTCTGLDARQVRTLMHCLDRLPEPVTLIFHFGASWEGACWSAFVDALPNCRGIKSFSDPNGGFSEREAERFLAAIHDNPVICELGMRFSLSTTAALNDYLGRNTTLRTLALYNSESKHKPCILDILPGFVANRTLTTIQLHDFRLTPAVADALTAPGKALAAIELHDCKFSSGTVKALASGLSSNDTLTSLGTGLSKTSTETVESIHAGLRSNRSLVSLDLGRVKSSGAHLLSSWTLLQKNLTLRNMTHYLDGDRPLGADCFEQWALLPHVKERLRENKLLPFLDHLYPRAKLALSILPGNLPYLPRDVSANIARLLLETDASALRSYCTLHMLALHKTIKAQHKPAFPGHLDLASHPAVQLLAQRGAQALPLPPDVMRSIALFCIHHQATDALHWLVVHASKGALDLRGSRFAPREIGWLIHWTRAAPCPIKLRLDQVALTKQDIADIAQQLTGNHALASLSLQGCAIAAEDLQLICAALKSNMAMVELRLSENLIAPGEKEAKRPQSHPMGTSHVIVDGEGKVVAQRSRSNANFLDDMARQWQDGVLGEDLYNNRLERHTSTYFLLAAIRLSLRRNKRLQDGVPDLASLLPDQAFVDEIAMAQQSFGIRGMGPASE